MRLCLAVASSWIRMIRSLPPPTIVALREGSETSIVKIHAPCGVVTITVPATIKKTDGKDVHVSNPGTAVQLHPGAMLRQTQILPLANPACATTAESIWQIENIQISIAYDGDFYCLVEAGELGFLHGLWKKGVELEDYDRGTKRFKALVERDDESCKRYIDIQTSRIRRFSVNAVV